MTDEEFFEKAKGSDANKQIERLEQECTELRNRNYLLSEMGKTSRDILEGTVKGYEAAMKQQNEDIRAIVTKYEEGKALVRKIQAELNSTSELLDAEKELNRILSGKLDDATRSGIMTGWDPDQDSPIKAFVTNAKCFMTDDDFAEVLLISILGLHENLRQLIYQRIGKSFGNG